MLKSPKIVSLVVVFILSTSLVYASSSASYQTEDENINFGSNEGYMESSSYALDLSDIPWTDRYSESSSYTLVDTNSDLDLSSPTPPPPTPSGGGSVSTGPGGGQPFVYLDVPVISSIPLTEERDLNVTEKSVSEEPGTSEESEVSEQSQVAEQQQVGEQPQVTEEPQIIEQLKKPKKTEEPVQILKPSPEETERIPHVKYVSSDVKKSCNRFDLLAIYLIIILIALYSLWKKRD